MFQEVLCYAQSVSLAVLGGLLFLPEPKHFLFLCFQVATNRNNHILQINMLVMFTAGHKWSVGSKEATNTGCVKKHLCELLFYSMGIVL